MADDNSFRFFGIDLPENAADKEFDETISKLSDEDLEKEIRYWTVYKRREIQLSIEMEKRQKSKENN